MGKMISKATVAAVAALSLCAALVASTEPAAAAFRMGGGGFGGFHGGGMGGWRGGWGGYGYRGYGYGGYGYGLGLGYGLALGYPYWGGDYGYPDYGYGYGYPGYGYGYPYAGAGYAYGAGNGCYQRRPVYSRRGSYLGRRWVNVCVP